MTHSFSSGTTSIADLIPNGSLTQSSDCGRRARLSHSLAIMKCAARCHSTATDAVPLATIGGQQTLDSYGGDFDSIPADHLTFLESCQRFHETEGHLFVCKLPEIHRSTNRILGSCYGRICQLQPTAHVSGKRVIVGLPPEKWENPRLWSLGLSGHVLLWQRSPHRHGRPHRSTLANKSPQLTRNESP